MPPPVLCQDGRMTEEKITWWMGFVNPSIDRILFTSFPRLFVTLLFVLSICHSYVWFMVSLIFSTDRLSSIDFHDLFYYYLFVCRFCRCQCLRDFRCFWIHRNQMRCGQIGMDRWNLNNMWEFLRLFCSFSPNVYSVYSRNTMKAEAIVIHK